METVIAEVTNVIEQSLNNRLLPLAIQAIIIGTIIGVSKLLLKRVINFLIK